MAAQSDKSAATFSFHCLHFSCKAPLLFLQGRFPIPLMPFPYILTSTALSPDSRQEKRPDLTRLHSMETSTGDKENSVFFRLSLAYYREYPYLWG
ncbi:MAG: hypothetical protein ACOYJE_03550 [Bacteroidaceae bacterium]